ncbi:hypothetical protein PLANPX_3600 [Lacipirellula parvula]|uniref:Uncharacterized protein n=1 Tax=Lacipirellula parvula TaxID=2650471 RepID=A0A5K7XBV1_9BACT|nr:hypothetical protein PLANPX_3600 [Lacipirellula parvula]
MNHDGTTGTTMRVVLQSELSQVSHFAFLATLIVSCCLAES